MAMMNTGLEKFERRGEAKTACEILDSCRILSSLCTRSRGRHSDPRLLCIRLIERVQAPDFQGECKFLQASKPRKGLPIRGIFPEDMNCSYLCIP
jgi:hypothetical protein